MIKAISTACLIFFSIQTIISITRKKKKGFNVIFFHISLYPEGIYHCKDHFCTSKVAFYKNQQFNPCNIHVN